MSTLSPQAAVRKQARESLKHQWTPAVIAFVILLIPLSLIDGMCTAIIGTVMTLIADEGLQELTANIIIYPLMLAVGYLLSPLYNGYIRLYYRNAVNGRMEISDLFFFFTGHRYARTLSFNLSFALRMAIPCLLFYSPVAAYVVLCGNLSNDFADSLTYQDCYFILCVLSTLLVTMYSMRYLFAFTAYAEEPAMSNSEIFKLSKQINRMFSGSVVKLLLSYTPWILLCITILPILYVGPYLTQGLCMGAKWMSLSYRDRTGVPSNLQEVMYESITVHDRV